MDDEGLLDPWVAAWIAANPERAALFDDLALERLVLAEAPSDRRRRVSSQR